jgi:ATP-dependent exoDNAse (exonuclease V) beta subunit
MNGPFAGRATSSASDMPDTVSPCDGPHALQASAAPDLAERRRALDVEQSYIVQAPAGSGKTGLLIQRYLKLLTCVSEPEEIIAITFTRKAAGEMRERVTNALAQAGNLRDQPDAIQTDHECTTHELACAAAVRDVQAGWRLAENPGRLRIVTFDSLCASLSRQMPVLSGFGHQPEIIEDASELYLAAASATIDLTETEETVAADVCRLLEHLDNDVARVQSLLAGMLARRDHWLRHIHGRDRDELEAALRRIRRGALKSLRELFELYPQFVRQELVELVRYAAGNLAAGGRNPPSARHESLNTLDALPGYEEQDFNGWCAIAELLLSKEGTWRKQHTVNDGFPTVTKGRKDTAKEWKERACALIFSLATDDVKDLLRHALRDVRLLPSASYSENQWEVLGAITRLLPRAVAQLRLVFQSRNKVDFSEIAQGALQALGDPDSPTDLALALDYSVRHLLIDEFQDTSISQYELIEKLTSGWEAGDGRSVLAVGDPMQSIYRFREAEVGLFLRVRTGGIGDISLHPISLSANFRSQRGIVEWVNQVFAYVMPEHEDIALGATPYIPSIAVHDALNGIAVAIHPFFNDDHLAEAARVAEITTQAARDDPSATVAILVRNRSHLHEIAPKLRDAGLRFRAIDIEGLAFRPVVQDLLALTRALLHLGDRLAWVTLLRAPWCGLTLADIHALVAASAATVRMGSAAGSGDDAEARNIADDRTVWELLNDDSRIAAISTDGRARLCRLRDVLKACISNRCRQSLRDTVEAAWLALGGPACAEDAADLGDAEAYLNHLEAYENAGQIQIDALAEGLAKLYALPDLKADGMLQIMTLHKAKGLEFDHVILPGLGRSPRNETRKLFIWMENLRTSSSMDEMNRGDELLLAPIQETGGEPDHIYAWLEKLNSEKARFEDERLLYVAATRAKKRLHLLGSTSLVLNQDGRAELRVPPRKSLLEKIWPVVQPVYEEAAQSVSPRTRAGPEDLGGSPIDQSMRRLAPGWALPAPPQAVRWKPNLASSAKQVDIEYSWVGETARHVGNIVHRWLRIIAEGELDDWTVARIRSLRDTFRYHLVAEGMDQRNEDTDAASGRVMQALIHAISDPRGRWLIGPQYEAFNELRMTAIIEGQPQDVVIDRTFRDTNGQRWVVDYKTSSHEGADLEGFLSQEQDRYRNQLDRYAGLMRNGGKPVRRALYFPLLRGWREWGDEI